MTIRVLIADDHAVVRSGLAMLINSQQDMQVVGVAADGREAVELGVKLLPQVVLMDLSMPPGENGLIATARLKELLPEIRVLILTMHDDEEYLFQSLKAGAVGYIVKTAPDFDLLKAIRTVHQGESYLYPSAAKSLIERFLRQGNKSEEFESLQLLTEREKQTLRLVAMGYANKDIAEQLCLSVKTVEAYKARIMEKLDLKTRPEMVRYAMKKGLLDLEG
ncbi:MULTISPECIES: response regulator [Pelosinus]|jgi:two-component system response regulator NreC|uniref:Response regulator receiver n=1 Tax=Pelosinus fermentans B4 TaxID=1149862 RepID=I9LBZ7_9FIRM|nr:response regulator receiver [Pelosinus fermentans B4]EIW23906.1 two component transcriptional regulator, LuxR family [Pelosinus fermentans A11]OAM94829.1 two component transcriptional regulator, LuxR family [Pelosinus fermentans DSM 17108]SDR18501.1 two component transcriptional regulator, LuxR family [Pelosinus fermentans]